MSRPADGAGRGAFIRRWVGLGAASRRHRERDDDDGRLALLMRAGQDGSVSAYDALLRGCVPIIAANASRSGLTADQSDEVVRETLVALHRLRHTYDPSRPFLPWLHAISDRRTSDVAGRHGGRNHAWPHADRAGSMR